MCMNYNLVMETDLTSAIEKSAILSHRIKTIKVGLQLNKIDIFCHGSKIIFDLRTMETIEFGAIKEIMKFCNKHRKKGKDIVLLGRDELGYRHIYRIFHLLRPDQNWFKN